MQKASHIIGLACVTWLLSVMCLLVSVTKPPHANAHLCEARGQDAEGVRGEEEERKIQRRITSIMKAFLKH